MIKLEKLQEPDVLRINSDRWTKELLASKDEDVKIKIKAKWNHRDIKTVLKKETHEKCAYCESKPLHVTFGDIEHICPKSRRFELAYKWDNLTLACEVCNGNKGSAEDLVDPYIDDLPSKFAFFGPMIVEQENSGAAKRTRITIDLNRGELLARRCDHLGNIKNALDANRANEDVAERTLTEEEIVRFYSRDGAEFSACARKFISDYIE